MLPNRCVPAKGRNWRCDGIKTRLGGNKYVIPNLYYRPGLCFSKDGLPAEALAKAGDFAPSGWGSFDHPVVFGQPLGFLNSSLRRLENSFPAVR